MTGPIRKDLVAETSGTTNISPYALSGALTGCQPFSLIGDNNTCHYVARDVDLLGVPTGAYEIGLGTYSAAGNSLMRTSILTSSNAGAPVVWPVGTRRIELGFPAAAIAALEAAVSTSSGSQISVSDEGTQLTSAASSLNFVGPLVTATNTGGAVTVTVKSATLPINVTYDTSTPPRPTSYTENGITYTFTYGSNGVATKTGGGHTTTYNYNSSGQLTGTTVS